MAEKKALQQITTEIERQFVEIDGEPYFLRIMDELELSDAHIISRWGKKLVRYFSEDNLEILSDQEYAEMGKRLKQVVKAILIAPDEIIDKLPDFQKMRLLEAVFTSPANKPEMNSENSSQDSNDSTEETPKDG